jgi:hypothetical protein
MDIIVILVASIVFGGAWWGLSRLGAPVAVVAALSLFVALIVWQSRTLFGLPL